MQGLIAKKIGMTRVIDSEGQMIPVTLLQVEKQKITRIRNDEKDGYHAIQVGYYIKPEHRLNKPDLARLRKAGIEENYTRFKEFRVAGDEGYETGAAIDAGVLADVGAVDVTGITKGRGFAGAVRRFNHKTGRQTHGSHFHRRPGSLGQRTTPGRVYKNKGMPGHMGSVQRTVQNLQVVDFDAETNVVALKGSVPGHKNGYVFLKPSVKN